MLEFSQPVDRDTGPIIEFVKQHPELYAKEHVHYVDKNKKDTLWEKIGEEIGRSGQDVRHWFQSQHTRYGKLMADMRNSGSGTSKNLMVTERAN